MTDGRGRKIPVGPVGLGVTPNPLYGCYPDTLGLSAGLPLSHQQARTTQIAQHEAAHPSADHECDRAERGGGRVAPKELRLRDPERDAGHASTLRPCNRPRIDEGTKGLRAMCITRIVQGPPAQRCGRQTPPGRFPPQLAVLADTCDRENRALHGLGQLGHHKMHVGVQRKPLDRASGRTLPLTTARKVGRLPGMKLTVIDASLAHLDHPLHSHTSHSTTVRLYHGENQTNDP